ncbi:MAG: histidine phosphatase family protein [Armatimonadetes bacterium]|nr:histidine phosphatase family protein [Armatimonadota bacterium]
MLKSLTFVRHGESKWNAGRKIQGHLESELSSLGRAQARALRGCFSGDSFDAVYSSDLIRAADTALLATGLGREQLTVTEALREISFGDWEGLSPEQVRRRWPSAWDAFRQDPINARPATGESIAQLSARVGGLIEHCHSVHAGQRVVFFTHGGPVRIALIEILGLSPRHWRTLRIANASLTRVEYIDGEAILTCFNLTGHLADIHKVKAAETLKADEQ